MEPKQELTKAEEEAWQKKRQELQYLATNVPDYFQELRELQLNENKLMLSAMVNDEHVRKFWN